jgi:AcrR family transcriptional regulator
MVGVPNRNRQAERREATRQEILSAAWDVARATGVAGLTLREIALRVGMQPPSLYSHFASKSAIYDAMFEQAWRQFQTELDGQANQLTADPRRRLLAVAMTYFDFAVSDLVRHQIMDVPMLPDFTPSEDAYRPALECYATMRSALREVGIRRDADLDLYTALIGGLVNQQLANDPAGSRWRALVPRAVNMLADELGLPPKAQTSSRRKP